MQIIKGLEKRSGRLTTQKIHIVDVDRKDLTLCGVNYMHSEILGLAQEGSINEVNCKKCLIKYKA